MELHNLKAPAENKKNRKRIGRGEGSGYAGTAGRGHDGHRSRSGYKERAWFEGGQMPLQRRIPKFGFNNPNRVENRGINLSKISDFIEAGKLETTIGVSDLVAVGLAHKNDRVKLLGQGEFSQKITIEVHAASKSAVEKVEKAGGTVTVLNN